MCSERNVSGKSLLGYLTGRAYRSLFHGLHDDLLQSCGLLLIGGDPCQPDNVIMSAKGNEGKRKVLMLWRLWMVSLDKC